MNKHNQTGSTAIITIAVVAVLVIGGVITYALMADSGDKNSDEASTSTVDNSENQQDDSAPSDDSSDEETLPADFPAAVPIYEPSSITTINTSGTNYVVGFTTDSTKAEVVAFYETELASNGWSIVLSDDDGRFTASNDGMNIVADVTEAGDKAIFTVTAPKQ